MSFGGLNANRVIHVLEQSLLFDDVQLKNKCLKLIGQNAHTVLNGSEIQSASPQTMKTIIQVDRISVRRVLS